MRLSLLPRFRRPLLVGLTDVARVNLDSARCVFSLRGLLGAGLALPTAGCLPAPMWATEPWPRRFNDEVVSSIRAGEMNREQVEAALGAPDVRRANDRDWVYGWTEEHGEWLVAPAAPMAGGATRTPVYSTFHALFLEFDASGALVRAESGHQRGEGVRFCDSLDHCLEHWDFNCLPFDELSLKKVPATATDIEQAMGQSPDGRCRLVVTVQAELPEWGLEFNVDQLWAEPTWLPRNAFAALELVAGSHEVTTCGDACSRESRCASPALAVTVVPAESGVSTVGGKRRVLLPEPSAVAGGGRTPQMRLSRFAPSEWTFGNRAGPPVCPDAPTRATG